MIQWSIWIPQVRKGRACVRISRSTTHTSVIKFSGPDFGSPFYTCQDMCDKDNLRLMSVSRDAVTAQLNMFIIQRKD